MANELKCVQANGKRYSSEIPYSTTERRVGTWIDGKPLYRKVIIDTTTSFPPGESRIAHGIQNIDTCIDIKTFKKGYGTPTFIFPYITVDGKATNTMMVTTTEIVIRTLDTWSTSNPTYFILTYTKTTD